MLLRNNAEMNVDWRNTGRMAAVSSDCAVSRMTFTAPDITVLMGMTKDQWGVES